MDFARDALPTPQANFVKHNFKWILGIAPIVIAGFRVLKVSNGDTEILDALLQHINVAALVLSTIMPLVCTVALWFLVAWFELLRPKTTKSAEWTPSQQFWVIPAFVAFMVSLCNSASGFLVVAAFVGYYVLMRRWGATANFVAFLPGLILAASAMMLVDRSWWLPAEIIKVKGEEPAVGYVLATDAQWTTFVTDANKLHVDRTALVESRQACTKVVSWFDRPVASLSFAPGTACPRIADAR